MFDNQPLINKQNNGPSSQGSQKSGDVSKKLKYSNWASTVFFAIILGLALYLAYPYLMKDSNNRLHPEHVAAVTAEDGYSAEAIEDHVFAFPNLKDEPTSNHFTGYLKAHDTREIFYWFEESQSETPENDPLMIWTNGGPGCSGLLGLLTEHGAYWVYDDLSLRSNPYSWNKMANIVYIEQPYGVGFSSVNDGDKVVTGDDNAVSDIDEVIRSFLQKFPKYADNDVYLSAESYGGHYVPLTAKKILENNDNGASPKINLKGFVLGNPLSSYVTNQDGFMTALWGHGLIKKSLYDSWMSECYGNEEAVAYSNTCEMLYVKAYMASYDADVYALDFPTCTMSDDDLASKKTHRSFNTERKIFHDQARLRASAVLENAELLHAHFEGDSEQIEQFRSELTSAIESTNVPYITCNSYDLVSYLNLQEVQEALHVKKAGKLDWDYCNDDVFDNWPDSDWMTSMKDTYLSLVNDYDIKMLIYSGDDDSVCSVQGTMTFLQGLGLEVDPKNDWAEWKFQDQLAGFYTKFLDKDGNSAIHFHTVRSAGHMVPTTQPERAQELLRLFFKEMK